MTSAFASVGLGARVSNFVFGSPNAFRANGLRRDALLSSAQRSGKWIERRRENPVFALDANRPESDSRLPRVWITEPAFDARLGKIDGREFVGSYPNGADPRGEKALALARTYFAEALAYSRQEDLLVRRDCFRAAEILFLHAASKGHVEAHLKLGVLYEQDLCDGLYWGWSRDCGEAGYMGQMPREAAAFECLSFAAVRGNAEACWRLGDLLAEGRGCAPHLENAKMLYRRAYTIAERESDLEALGASALRLGKLTEAAGGGIRSFKQALSWYRISLNALDLVVQAGAWHSKRMLHEARRGVSRMHQEIHGGY